MSALITDADLAARFKMDVEKLHELRRRNNWPCVRLGRFEVRFTEEQVDQIIAIQTETRTPAPAKSTPAIQGQTKGSVARKRTA